MRRSRIIAAAMCAALALTATAQQPPPAPAPAPQGAPPPAASGQTFSQGELDQLLAPIALYPDALLAQVLMASTYPLEVVEAARWVKANPDTQGQGARGCAAEAAVGSKRQVARACSRRCSTMMNEKLDWTQKLGDAFLAQQKEVMETAQSLRAEGAGAGLAQGHASSRRS